MTFYNAGKCDACGCHLTLVQDTIDDISQVGDVTHFVMGHEDNCKVRSDPW